MGEGSHEQYFGEEGDAGDVGEYLGDDGDIWTGAIEDRQFLDVVSLTLLTSYTPKGWGERRVSKIKNGETQPLTNLGNLREGSIKL